MTTKQKRFCQEYLIDLNATQAAIRAGYSEKSAYTVGQRMLKNVEVKKYIVEQMERLKNEKISSAQEVLEYLTSVMRGEQKEQVPLMYYDKQILEEKSASIKDRLKAAELIKKENKQNNVIICDSTEPKSIAEMYSYNLRVLGAKKGADSVEYGIKWLQDLEEIVIDPKRCPNTAREFLEYEIEKDTNGNFKGCFSDKNNHSIDAVRYSREFDMRNIKIG